MKEKFVLLDVGGTQIKAGLAVQSGWIEKTVNYPACAMESSEKIFANFAAIIRSTAAQTEEGELRGIGMAFPGPFDYEKGVCLIQGLHKYDSIYGMSVADEIRKRVPGFENVPFVFCHDAEAFALGEVWLGLDRADSVLCLCIGTGTGSAYIRDGRIIKSGKGVPPDGWIYKLPYKEGVVDDYISARGLEALGKQYLGRAVTGKELYELCGKNDAGAQKAMQRFGWEFSRCVTPLVERFSPDTVVLGGQIAKSFPYFGQEFENECGRREIRLYLEYETSVRAMQGVLRRIIEKQREQAGSRI